MADRPILFSGAMVRALLAGRKTQTRRVLKPQPKTYRHCTICGLGVGEWSACEEIPCGPLGAETAAWDTKAPCDIGDRLYVREAWRAEARWDDVKPARIKPGSPIYYAADPYPRDSEPGCAGRLRPGMFMPRWASRLTLTVTDVRVQRLTEISEEDAIAEGCFKGKASGRVYHSSLAMLLGGDQWPNARLWYADLWDSLNVERGFGWDSNPWVIAVSFSVERRNIDAPSVACGDTSPAPQGRIEREPISPCEAGGVAADAAEGGA